MKSKAAAPHIHIVRDDETSADESPVAVDLDTAFRRYAPYVARIAVRLLGSRDEAEDIVQEVFLEAHRGLKSLRSPSALKGWLATITVRRVRRTLRKRVIRRALGGSVSTDAVELVDRKLSPERRAMLVSVYRVLDTLPVQVRLAWVLRHVEDEPLERVAQMCECSRTTAHRRITTAQLALAKAFES